MEIIRGKAIFPENISIIEMDAFSQRFDLIEANIPEGVKIIEKGAFASSGLEKVSLPRTLEKIEAYAFVGCRRLTTITIPDDVAVNELAFYGCNNLTSICWHGELIRVACRNGLIVKETAIPKLNKYWNLFDVLLMTCTWGMNCVAVISVFLILVSFTDIISGTYHLCLALGFLIMDNIFFFTRLSIRKILSNWICVFQNNKDKE